MGLGAALVVWMCASPAMAATTVYTNESDFIAASTGLPTFVNEFTNLTFLGWLVHPIEQSSNGISYRITSVPALQVVAFDGAVSTGATNAALVVTFTSGNVTGVGGHFFAGDTNAALISGSVTVGLDDGTVATVDSVSGVPPAFVGFLSDGPVFNTLTITNSSGTGYPAMSHFIVVGGVPALSPALTSGNSLTLSWPTAPTGFVLQASTSLQGATWTNVDQTPQLTNNHFQESVPTSGSSGFFRLIRP
jgi:hypothetical protein